MAEPAGGQAPTPSWTSRHPAATYTLSRLGLFALFLAPLLLVTRNLFISLITAAIASSVLSIFLLRRQRDALSAAIVARNERANEQMAKRAASEDAWDEAQRQASAEDQADATDETGDGTGSARQ